MKRTSFGKAFFALLFCVAQLSVSYANNCGTGAPAPAKASWKVSMESLKKFDEFQTVMAKIKPLQRTKSSAMFTNSSLTNYRPGNQSLDMTWLEVTFTDGTPTAYLNAFGDEVVIWYGETDHFDLPDLHNVGTITMRHFGSYFGANEYGTIKANNSSTVYTAYSYLGDAMVWGFDGADLTGGLEIIMY